MGANDKAEATYHRRTPDTDMMRGRYIDGKHYQSKYPNNFFAGAEKAGEEFDRWLKQVKAEAWQEGFEDGKNAAHNFTGKFDPNPYKED